MTGPSRSSTPAGRRGWGPFLREVYVDGDKCDLTGDARRAEVRYVCQEESSTVSIVSITEVVTCSYIVVVSAPKLCKHPFFSRKVRRVLFFAPGNTQGLAAFRSPPQGHADRSASICMDACCVARAENGHAAHSSGTASTLVVTTTRGPRYQSSIRPCTKDA